METAHKCLEAEAALKYVLVSIVLKNIKHYNTVLHTFC